jgi:hypothetical protein
MVGVGFIFKSCASPYFAMAERLTQRQSKSPPGQGTVPTEIRFWA